MRHRSLTYKYQKGTAILIFALIVIAGASYLFIHKLNSSTHRYDRAQISNDALKIAKDALIGWSLHHPDSPGMLPFPDRNGDAGGYDGLSDCPPSTLVLDDDDDDLLLGRLPWLGQGNPCRSPQTGLNIDARDFLGEQVWYAVSKNLLYQNQRYPFVSPALLNKTEDWITVRDSSGNVLSDRVAFVLISPGVPLDGQDRSAAAPNVANYLDDVTIGGTNYNNADDDQDYIIYPDSEYTQITTDNFNDQLIFVTIDEFMNKLEQLALNEVSNILSTYHDSHGAFPWLSPYADPKAELNNVSGIADACNAPCDPTITLNDSAKEFLAMGVSVGDIIYNVTDGSIGTINDVSANSLDVDDLELGNDNDFGTGDEYHILRKQLQQTLSGTATVNSSGLLLEDNLKDFANMDIELGDVVENIDDGSVGIISLISANQITVDSLTGGVENDFDNGENYLIRSNYGIATNAIASPSLTTLQDSNKNFLNLGVQAGDLVRNTTDNSIGRIIDVAANELTVDQLYFGSDNQFQNRDTYTIPKFNSVTNTRLGQLPFHEVAEVFPTTLNLDWAITVDPLDPGDIDFDTVAFPAAPLGYQTNLKNYLRSYAANSTEFFPNDIASCVWSTPEIAECTAYSDNYDNISGRLTFSIPPGGSLITDANADFVTDDVDVGDLAQNYDDESPVAAGVADAGSTGTTLIDSGIDFTAYEPHRYLVQNNTLEGELGVGKIQGIISRIIDADTIEVESYDGESETEIEFRPGDNIQIYEPETFVVSDRNNAQEIDTSNYIDGNTPDFDDGERYRIMRSANSFSATPDNLFPVICINGGACQINDADGDFLNKGIEPGDVIKLDMQLNLFGFPITGFGFGRITVVTATDIFATLYGNIIGGVPTLSTYTVYYDYIYSRRHEWQFRFRGERFIKTDSNKRLRDVCLGYEAGCNEISGFATDDSAGLVLEDDTKNFLVLGVSNGDIVANRTDGSKGLVTALTATEITVGSLTGGDDNTFEEDDVYSITFPDPVNFTGNGGQPMITVRDYDADGTTEIGRATFTPSAASNGSLRVLNIDYFLQSVDKDLNNDGDYEDTNEVRPDIPEWFIRNKWYQYFYIAYSDGGDIPGDTLRCDDNGFDDNICLTLNIDPPAATVQNNIRAIIIYSGRELANQPESQASGLINAYFEGDADNDALENANGDNTFDKTGYRYNAAGEPINYNDRIRIGITCDPLVNTDICWQ
jgi:hypothetical protein